MKYENIERGVMVVKNRRAWQSMSFNPTVKGWGPMASGDISDPKHCTDPTWKTHLPIPGFPNPDWNDLLTAELVMVERRTVVEIIDDEA